MRTKIIKQLQNKAKEQNKTKQNKANTKENKQKQNQNNIDGQTYISSHISRKISCMMDPAYLNLIKL